MTLIVTERAHLKHLVSEVFERGEFAFDCETLPGHGEKSADQFRLDPRCNQVAWLAIATHGLSFAIPMGHPHGEQDGITTEPRVGSDGKTRNFKIPVWSPAPRQMTRGVVFAELESLFYDDRILKAGCNVKFDLETCQKYYDDEVMPPGFWDVQIASHMLNENHRDYRLGTLVKREFNFTYDKKVGEQIERYGFKAAGKYVHYDAKYTWLLLRKYRPMIEREGLSGLWALEMDVLEVLLYMEQTGAMVDVEAATKLKVKLGRDLARLKGEMYRIAGREINLNSAPQKQQLFFGSKKDGGFGLKSKVLTDGGAPSTAREAVENLDHPFIETYLEHEDVNKVHGTYLTAYLGGEVVTESGGKKRVEVRPSILVDGKVHASFKQHGTVTGRFSCSTPNLQNIPRPDDDLGRQVRGLFIPPAPDWSLVVADYGQIEYIVMAHLSRDPMLVKAFIDGVDLHQYVAAMVFSADIEDITKLQRGTAKNTNFAVAYGAGDEKVAKMSKISFADAKSFRAKHRRLMPHLYRWTERVVADARQRRPPHVTTLLGRKRRLPGLLSSDWGVRKEAERQAVNTVVQGSAADIIKLAMVRAHRLCDDEIRLSLSIHDELVLVCPNSRVDEAQEILRDAMLGPGIAKMLSVPMKIDMHVVQRWSDAK